MPLRGPIPTSPEPAAADDGARAPPRASAAACAIIALSDDPLLLEALTGAALAGSAVITSPSDDRFIDQLVANAAGIALIDASSVSAPLKVFIATLREQFPQLLLILAGSAQLQAQLSQQLTDGSIFRFVHKPASSQRLKLFIDAALRQQAAPERPIEARPAGEPPAGGRSSGVALAAGLSGVALAAGAIAWAVWHQSAPPAPAAPAQADAAASSRAPDDAAAREAAAREAALEQAQRTALGARADQLSVYLQLARKRLASGALIEPADDSARSYVASAVALAPEDPEVRAASIALGEALIAEFRRALAAGDTAEARRWLSACGDYRINSATLNELTAQLRQAQEPVTRPAAPAVEAAPATAPPAATVPPADTAPPAVTAPPAAASANTVVSEGSLTRLLFVPPDYPDEALAQRITGWVELEFTVTDEGKVADIVVLAAEPRGVFERAARAALARSRYRPVQRDGVPVAQRTRIRVRFQL